MTSRTIRVRDVAATANLGLDEALLTLWDAGLDEFETPGDVIPRRRIRDVTRALGLSDDREQLKVDYWIGRSGLTRDELKDVLKEQGISLGSRARRIPKNSLRRLRRIFDARIVIRDEEPARETLPPLRWEVVGERRSSRMLEEAEVRAIHAALEADFAHSEDPVSPPGVRDDSLLSSAMSRPHTSLRAAKKYPTVEMAAAALFHSLIHNHPFYNGNKRTALVSILAFLDENGVVLTSTEQDLFRFTLRTAQHRLVSEHANQRADREVLEIAKWVKSNSRPIERGEHPMKWVTLKQRLRELDCSFTPAPGVGNRLNLSRRVRRRARFGVAKRETLSTQVAWPGDGTDADRSTIHKIRRDLQLDDAHDVDSASFYADAKIDGFIIDYRRILRRLAKL